MWGRGVLVMGEKDHRGGQKRHRRNGTGRGDGLRYITLEGGVGHEATI